jgi:hypothetical protein
MSVGKVPKRTQTTNNTTMNRKTLNEASLFFFELGMQCMNKQDDPRLDISEEEYDELTECAHAWLMLEAYFDRVLA